MDCTCIHILFLRILNMNTEKFVVGIRRQLLRTDPLQMQPALFPSKLEPTAIFLDCTNLMFFPPSSVTFYFKSFKIDLKFLFRFTMYSIYTLRMIFSSFLCSFCVETYFLIFVIIFSLANNFLMS